MKNSIRVLSVLLTLAFSTPLLAAEMVRYTGRFEMKAVKAHNSVIPGTMKLYFDGEAFTKAEAIPDKPVFGKKDFFTKEQNYVYLKNGDTNSQMSVAALFEGTPHKFYLVWVGNSSDADTTFDGIWYRVNMPIDQILVILKNGIVQSPEGWQNIGTGNLRVQ
jgi:hypothetical protein